MSDYTSEIKTIPFKREMVYSVLSDLNNLRLVQDKIPQDKINDFSFDEDSISFSVSPVGNVTIHVIEREAPKTIKFGARGVPAEANLWIQLVEIEGEEVTKLKITARTSLNPFLKAMVSKPLQDGINKIADILAAVPYDEIV